MKLTFISDTHGRHADLKLDAGDILIHCGDFTGRGDLEETEAFARFMGKQAFTHKIVVAGNHDWCFEDERRGEAEACLREHGLIYLNDSGIRLCGLNFWGSPITPVFFRWAFNRQRGEEIQQHWQMIPGDTDVLITHGPPLGILDTCNSGLQVGCADLLSTIEHIRPKVHAFGHIHEAYGTTEQAGTQFINASNLDDHYRPVNPPISLVLDMDASILSAS